MGKINGDRKTFWVPAWIVAAAVLAVGVVLLSRIPVLQGILLYALEWVRGSGTAGPLIFAAVYVLATVLLLPGSILTLGAGALFGVVKGSILVSLASTLGATLAFFLGRTLVRGWVEKKIGARPRFRAVDQAVAREGWKIVGLTRLSPLLPFNLLNYGYGITKVSPRDYILASWAGMIPGTVMYVYIGALAGDLSSLGTGAAPAPAWQWAVRASGLLATVAVTYYVTRVARRALREKVL